MLMELLFWSDSFIFLYSMYYPAVIVIFDIFYLYIRALRHCKITSWLSVSEYVLAFLLSFSCLSCVHPTKMNNNIAAVRLRTAKGKLRVNLNSCRLVQVAWTVHQNSSVLCVVYVCFLVSWAKPNTRPLLWNNYWWIYPGAEMLFLILTQISENFRKW